MRKLNSNGLLSQLRDFGIGPIVGMFISMLTVPITTRLVSPDEFGKSSLFTLVQTIFNLVVLLGIDQSYVRFYNQKDIDKKNLLFNSLLLPFTFCIVVIIAVLLFGQKISFFMFGQYEPLIMFSFILFLPSLLLNRFALLSIRMDLRGKLYSLLNVIQQILNFSILIVFLFFYQRTFRSIVYATIVNSIIGAFIAILASKQFSLKTKYYIDRKLITNLLVFGLPLVPASILSWVLNSFDKVALRSWSSFEQLGLYAAAFKIVALLTIFQTIFTTTWTPIAYKWYEDKIQNKKFEDISTIVLSVMVIFFSLIVVFRDFIMLFLGPEYRNTTEIFVFLLFVPVMYTVSETTSLGIGFAKKTIYTLYISIICAICNIAGNYFLVPKYGAKGAAISTCISYIAFFWARTLFSRKLWFKFDLWKYLVIISLLSFFGINMLIWKSKVLEICIFISIVISCFIYCKLIYNSTNKKEV